MLGEAICVPCVGTASRIVATATAHNKSHPFNTALCRMQPNRVAASQINCRVPVLLSELAITHAEFAAKEPDPRYLLLNLAATEVQAESFQAIKALEDLRTKNRPRLGVGAIISYFRSSPAENLKHLKRLLTLCEKHELAVVVQLDGEQLVDGEARPEKLVGRKPARVQSGQRTER